MWPFLWATSSFQKSHNEPQKEAQLAKNAPIWGSRENVQGYFRRLPSTSVFGFNTSKHAETGS